MQPTELTDELMWNQRWTAWLRRRISTRLEPARLDRQFPKIRTELLALQARQRIAPIFVRSGRWLAPEMIADMASEAAAALAAEGLSHNGKWNAPAGRAALTFLDEVNLPALIGDYTGLAVDEPHDATYLAYQNTGEHLDFHLDQPEFGDVSVIVCLSHESPDDAGQSSTVFVGANGFTTARLRPGDCVIFDGFFTPHGRTPVQADERISLISFGCRTPTPSMDPSALPEPPPLRDRC